MADGSGGGADHWLEMRVRVRVRLCGSFSARFGCFSPLGRTFVHHYHSQENKKNNAHTDDYSEGKIIHYMNS